MRPLGLAVLLVFLLAGGAAAILLNRGHKSVREYDWYVDRRVPLRAVGWPNGHGGSCWNIYERGRLRLTVGGRPPGTYDFNLLQVWRTGSHSTGFGSEVRAICAYAPDEPLAAAYARAVRLLAEHGLTGRESLDEWLAGRQQGDRRGTPRDVLEWKTSRAPGDPNPYHVWVRYVSDSGGVPTWTVVLSVNLD